MNTQVGEALDGNGQAALTKLANDYSGYFKADITEEISRLEEYIEESLAKLEEFISLFEMKESETQGWMEMALPALLNSSTYLSTTFSKRLDTLASLIESLKGSVDQLEIQVSQAEVSLGASSSFRSMLNYFRKPDSHEISPKLPLEPPKVDVDEFFTKTTLN